jgi:hypothetical protein
MTQRDKCESDLLHRVSPGESGRGNWFIEFLVDEVFVFIKQSFPFFPIKRPLPDSRLWSLEVLPKILPTCQDQNDKSFDAKRTPSQKRTTADYADFHGSGILYFFSISVNSCDLRSINRQWHFENRKLKPGGGEIRTHEAFRPSGFQDRRDQPLCHPSRQMAGQRPTSNV